MTRRLTLLVALGVMLGLVLAIAGMAYAQEPCNPAEDPTCVPEECDPTVDPGCSGPPPECDPFADPTCEPPPECDPSFEVCGPGSGGGGNGGANGGGGGSGGGGGAGGGGLFAFGPGVAVGFGGVEVPSGTAGAGLAGGPTVVVNDGGFFGETQVQTSF